MLGRIDILGLRVKSEEEGRRVRCMQMQRFLSFSNPFFFGANLGETKVRRVCIKNDFLKKIKKKNLLQQDFQSKLLQYMEFIATKI